MNAWKTFLLLFTFINLSAQDYPKREINLAQLTDEIFSVQDGGLNYQDLYENYAQLISNPLDLNYATADQLSSLYILNSQQIQNFIYYRKEIGLILSIYELQLIEGFTKEVFLKLIPFVTVVEENSLLNKSLLKRILKEPNNYLLIRYTETLETQKGFSAKTDSASRFIGKPGDFYTRFRTSKTEDFSVGFTLKKDAGEPIQWNPTKKYYGFDFLSFHTQLLNKGKIKNLIVGDFQSQFGQGLTLGSVFGIGKNAEAVTTMRRSNLGFLPYTSQYEAGYFRGLAITYDLIKNIKIHSFISSKGRDGNLQQDSSYSSISSFNFTGLHRTPTELESRNSFQESNLGFILNYKNQSLDAGILFHQTLFDKDLNRNPSAYNQFYFSGNRNQNIGGFLNYNFSNISLFSEFSHTINHGNAVIIGLLTSLNNQLDVSLVYRKFDRDFYSFYSNAISENSTPQNESGLYWGWKYTFNKKYSTSGYVDLFEFPWLKYRNYAPTQGSEWLIRFNYKPSKTINLFVQVREENKSRNSSATTNLYQPQEITKRSYWINMDYSASQDFSFRTRIQFSDQKFENRNTSGMAIIQDASYNWKRFTLTGRYAIFDTDDFDNRIYSYEKDVWLAFTFPPYFGKGIREYLVLEYRLNKKTDLWIRWSQTHYNNKETVGSGGNTITGNTQNDIRFQVRIRF